MNKKDLAIAKRALAARQVKNEHKFIKSIMLQRTGSTTAGGPGVTPVSSGDRGTNNGDVGGANTRAFQPTSSVNSPKQSTTLGPRSPRSSSLTSLRPHGENELAFATSQMVTELAQRATTARTTRRKVQSTVSKSMQGQGRQGDPADDDFETPVPPLEANDNFFMPKREILRSDGASLSDIYNSKRADSWGVILKAQLAEEEREKIRKRTAKNLADKKFGDLLKKQLDDRRQKGADDVVSDAVFAALEGKTAQRMADLQKGRTEDAINRHRQFISNAVEDIETKRVKKAKELMLDITASTIMINKAKQAIAAEEQKKVDGKEYHKRYADVLFQENLANIERKANLKKNDFAEDKRIIRENDAQYYKEMQRREEALKKKITRSSEGPAHHVVQQIVDQRKEHDEAFYGRLFATENTMNSQLKMSEDAAAARLTSNGQSLEMEWQKNTLYKARKKKEEEESNNKILQTMRTMLKTQEVEDVQKRQAKVDAGKRYQHELDAQLQELRTRSFNSLAKTMSEQEMLYNAELLRGVGVSL
mmetsp:Transcript_13745/g.30307  ORF Transcript_13745/g.30307 Transcript_13745/m.30307 type:complete len:534 (-) Transcript_13745:226-1827(-)